MRYIRWIFMLLILIFIILQIFYNFKNLTETTFAFGLALLPGREFFHIEVPVWQGLLILFLIGFGLAILFEIYYWAKYTMTIRSQNKTIKALQKEIAKYKPETAPEPPAPAPGNNPKPVS